MKILIDIGHPGHVHLFKNFAWQMEKKGHEILFTVRDKEYEIYLLKTFGFKYISFGKHYKSKLGKIIGLIKFDLKMLRAVLSFRPNLLFSHGSVYAAQIGGLLHIPHLSLEDTGNMEQIHLYRPFTKVILTSSAFHKELGIKQIRYNGYHELAYLHPKVFSLDNNIRNQLNIKSSERIFFLRFVSWSASHDFRQNGLTDIGKRELVEKLKPLGRVLISSEGDLPEEFKEYKFILPPEKIHDVLAEVDLFVGEGATMASECAMIGTPAIYVNSMEAGTINDHEKNNLLFHFRNIDGVIDKALKIISNPNSKEESKKNRDQMLRDKIDVTTFFIWFIENYPQSFQIMKENPDYQYNFR
jgi:predicted glycosyltransferase